ncbi:MAG: pyridoxal phosphate-dependent aminotransferase [Myxococcota bacterium]|jgi:aspartate aminotransferase|nr:pyridoxal phosphate-dependent aminotransferase [Myxococcota bacterium]
MPSLSSRVQRIKPSPTLSITQKAAALRQSGLDILSFSAGEPDFDTPPHIVAAAEEALRKGQTRYTATAGVPALRSAVAAESERIRGVPTKTEDVIITVGAKHALYLLFQVLLDPGDEVIIPAPYWVSYPDQVLLADGVPVIAPTFATQNFELSCQQLEKLITARTKALVINTPSNPTGSIYRRDSLAQLTRTAVEAGLTVICDEIYRELVYGGATHVSPLSLCPPDKRDHVFVVDGVSKTYAMTGWRIGWGIGHTDIIKAMTKIQGQDVSNPTSFAQMATLAALKGPREFLKEWQAEYTVRRDLMVERLSAIPGLSCLTPQGAFYVLADVTQILEKLGDQATDVTLSDKLLEEAHVAVVPGSAFGAPGTIRLSYATSRREIEMGVARMAEALGRMGQLRQK